MVNPIIVEGIITGIQVLSGLAQAAGVPKEKIKGEVDKKYAELEKQDPAHLPDVG